ncbi:MAG: glycine dehydrogenase, partial [Clostridiales bacterium]|nr:glycine dehydrogenase [Clostridiales bacterium]
MFPYLPTTKAEEEAMLNRLGIQSIDDLFNNIPDSIKLKRKLDLEDPKSEIEVERLLQGFSNQNLNASNTPIFLGAGIYDHYIPSTVRYAINRSEFYTAYT